MIKHSLAPYLGDQDRVTDGYMLEPSMDEKLVGESLAQIPASHAKIVLVTVGLGYFLIIHDLPL